MGAWGAWPDFGWPVFLRSFQQRMLLPRYWNNNFLVVGFYFSRPITSSVFLLSLNRCSLPISFCILSLVSWFVIHSALVLNVFFLASFSRRFRLVHPVLGFLSVLQGLFLPCSTFLMFLPSVVVVLCPDSIFSSMSHVLTCQHPSRGDPASRLLLAL